MVRAIPVNKKGEQTGEPRNFPDSQWKRMVESFGKALAYKKVDSTEPVLAKKADLKEVELVSTKKAISKKSS